MKLAMSCSDGIEREAEALQVGPLAVHQRFFDGRWQVSHIASGRGVIPDGICCKPFAIKLANSLKDLNWDFSLPRHKSRVKFPPSVKADMDKARFIAAQWVAPCAKCKKLASTVNS